MKRPTIILGLLLAAGCSEDTTTPPVETPFVAMTWNLYLGADLTPVLTAPTPGDIPARAAAVWGQIQATDFAARAAQVAQEIAVHRPDVIGLQEVSLYRIQSPGDAATGGTTPATTVALDHLQTLTQALQAQGLAYEVAAVVSNFDVEVPMLVGLQLDDIRLTDRDVILVRSGLSHQEALEENFTTNAQVQAAGGLALELLRGWVSVVVNHDGQEVRIVNTHLETQAFSSVQQAQAQEILDAVVAETRPVLIMGDMNSDAGGQQTPTYDQIVGAGCRDLWETAGGETCCYDSALQDDTETLTQRIDFIFATGPTQPVVVDIAVVGTQMQALWPSDHAGVVASLRYE